MGTDREEVIGRQLTNFSTEDSRRYAEKIVFPEFFRTGLCKDVPYQFVKKNGDIIDILLSAIAIGTETEPLFDRSLFRSMLPKETVPKKRSSGQKKNFGAIHKILERKVRKRTQEITSILKYTPAVVYIKDKEGCYNLVNSQFEELFAMQNGDVQGKTDYDIFPTEVADQFRHNDRQVLSESRSCQVEEQIPQSDGIHTYLSVKFPVYDETGTTSGVCGISTDITAVKKAQEQLRRLSGRIMDSQEKERTAIARELHDELGQLLTALRMDSVWIRNRLQDTDSKAADRALTMCTLIDKTIEDVRSMAIRLRPGVLDDSGARRCVGVVYHRF